MLRMWFPLVFFWYWGCFHYPAATVPRLLPPLLHVTCSDQQTCFCRQQNYTLWTSCLWDGDTKLYYWRASGFISRIRRGQTDLPSCCSWYWRSAWVHSMILWPRWWVLGSSLEKGALHLPWDSSHIPIRCISLSCRLPSCLHQNLSIEVFGQDVQLLLLSPLTRPIQEQQPVQLGWCAHLKSSKQPSRYNSQGGEAGTLLPTTVYNLDYPHYHGGELYHMCTSYFSYHLTVHYTHQGLRVASLYITHRPQVSFSLDLPVEPILVHIFSANSKWLSITHSTISLSWSLLLVSPRRMAYRLLDIDSGGFWSTSYNPYALQNNYAVGHIPQHSRKKVVAFIYFFTEEGRTGELKGELGYSNATLTLSSQSEPPSRFTLNTRKIKIGTYLFSPSQGLYYSTQEGSTPDDPSSIHYFFYQQQSISYLFTIEFLQLQWYKFNVHLYLNRKGVLLQKSFPERNIEVHVFNSGPSFLQSVIYIVWFVPIQHPLLQNEWTFELQLFDSREEFLIQNNTYTYRDHVKNATHFIPRSVLPFNPVLYTGFVAQVNCTRSQLIRAVLKATINTYASKESNSMVACLQKNCFIKQVNIWKPDLSNHVLKYSKGTSFTLSADVQMNCPSPKQRDNIWKIFKVSDVNTTPDWSKPFYSPGLGRQDLIMLEVPGSTLDDGLYLFNFTVKLIAMDTLESLEGSDSVFVQVGSLVAIIAGGNFRTVGFSDQWTLDGSYSYDTDAALPSERLTFTWYCTKQKSDYVSMTLSLKGKCRPDQEDLKWTTSSDEVQTVPPETLQENAVYYFCLVVQKGDRTAQAEQMVHIKPNSLPVLNITCIENCGRSVTPTERFCLAGKCTNCEKLSRPLYHWSLLMENFTEVNFDWDAKSTTGRSSPYICIKSFSFINMTEETYMLTLKASIWRYRSSVYSYLFFVNSPPHIGQCLLKPTVGIVFLTKFVVHCSGFKDKHLPLTYKIRAASNTLTVTKKFSTDNNTLGTIVYFGYQPKIPPSFLPIGVPSKQYTLPIYIEVYDALGAFSQLTLQAKVHGPFKGKQTDVILNELHGFSSGPKAPITYFLESGDYFNAGYFVYMVASALNNIEVLQRVHSSKTELREILLNRSAGIPAKGVMELNQMVSGISQITQEITEVNRKSQLLAVRKLKELSEELKRYRDKNTGSKEIEVLSTGIFEGLSNILKASLLDLRNVHRNGVKETLSAAEVLAELILQGKVPGENETVLETNDWTITVRKVEKWDVSGTFSKRVVCKNCFYSKIKQEGHDELPADAEISTVLFEFHRNPFSWLPFSEDISTMVTGFKMTGTRSNGNTVGIIPEVAEMIMTRKDEGSAIFELNMGHDRELLKTTGGFSFEVRRNSKEVFIQIVTELKLTFQVFVYLDCNASHPPIVSFSVSHNKNTVTRGKKSKGHDCAAQAPYIFCLSRSLIRSIFQGNSAEKWNISIILRSDPFKWDPSIQVIGIRLFTADCLSLDGIQGQWKECVCHLGPQTSWEKLHCICTAKKRISRTASPQPRGTSKNDIMFLAGKINVYPDPVDMKAVLLEQTNNNPVTTVTVVFIFVVYIWLAFWTTRKDRADMESRDHVVVLSDNDPYDQACYFITVHTGSRFGAGTTADVFIQLIGHCGASDIHCLRHPEYPTLVRGAVNTFLLTSKNDLGDIYSFYAWHNNGGSSPNWFLSRIKVQNVFTKQSWMFICRKWFALNKDDGLIERSFVVTHPTTPLSKMDLFLINLTYELGETHLWLSVFAPISTSSLNRLHRLSSCLAMLLCNLLFNIMFFNADKDKLVISEQPWFLRSLLIGIQSAFISFPLQIFITALFKYAQQEPLPQESSSNQPKQCSASMTRNLRNWKELLQKWCFAEGYSFRKCLSNTPDSCSLEQRSRKRWGQVAKKWSNCTISEGDANIIAMEEDIGHEANATNNFISRNEKKGPYHQIKPLNSPIMLFHKRPQVIISWWYRYVLWVLVLVTSTVSSFFIIFYGLSYDYEASFEWLVASSISFCESVVLLQTLNVVFFSALRTLYPKYCENIPWSSRETNLEIKLDNVTMDADEKRELHYDLVRLRGTKQYHPLEEEEITLFKKKQKVQSQAFVFIKDVICHFVFLILILNIARSIENTTSFYYNQDIHNKFSQGLEDISKSEHIYTWLKNVFLHLIHNKYRPTYLSKSWSKILGLPRMRQIRAKNTSKECFHTQSLENRFLIRNSHCLHKYGYDPEDQRDHLGLWTNVANKSVSNLFSNFSGYTYYSVTDQWRYASYGELNTYGAGGYTFHFYPEEQQTNSTKRIAFLKQRNWLDENTWALIVELTTFNSDADLFCSISVVFEMSDLGPVNTSLSIHSYKLPVFQLLSMTQKFVYITVVFMLVFYIADEVCMVKQYRLKYVRNISNLINFGIKSVCLFFLVYLSFKFKLASSLIEFYLHHPKEFIPFHKVSHIDQTIRIALGFLIFLIILKTLRYSRFFYDVRLAQRSMLAALPGICSMALVVAVYFFVYMAFGYLVFGQYEWNYHTMIHSAQTVFSYCVSAFKDTAFESNRVLGSLFLSSFMMVMICVLINLFQAVIMSSYEDMKQPVYEEPSDEAEVVKFLCHKIRRMWFLATCRTPPESDAELFIRVLYGHSERRNSSHLGLKARKINGRKMVYLVV